MELANNPAVEIIDGVRSFEFPVPVCDRFRVAITLAGVDAANPSLTLTGENQELVNGQWAQRTKFFAECGPEHPGVIEVEWPNNMTSGGTGRITISTSEDISIGLVFEALV